MQSHKTITILSVLAGAATAALADTPVVFTDSGLFATDVLDTIDVFRAALGDLNPPAPGSVGTGRREVNWDGAPDAVSAPNLFPGDFFNGPAAPRARGIEFSTPGTGLMLSATAASGVGIEFDNILPFFSAQFEAFSPQRLFASLGSTVTWVDFFVPGTDEPAASRGLGVVFTGVDNPETTTIELFDAEGNSLGVWAAPAPLGSENFSFLAISFDEPVIARAKVTAGEAPIDGIFETDDLVVMDDFIFGEPVAIPQAGCTADLSEPFGVLNFFDVVEYIALYNAGDPAADIAAPLGTLNFYDIAEYIQLYNAGCP